MDYSETPENDDFRGREFDCFLEEKKGYRKGEEGAQNLSLKRKSIEKLSSFCTVTCSTYMLSFCVLVSI